MYNRKYSYSCCIVNFIDFYMKGEIIFIDFKAIWYKEYINQMFEVQTKEIGSTQGKFILRSTILTRVSLQSLQT